MFSLLSQTEGKVEKDAQIWWQPGYYNNQDIWERWNESWHTCDFNGRWTSCHSSKILNPHSGEWDSYPNEIRGNDEF